MEMQVWVRNFKVMTTNAQNKEWPQIKLKRTRNIHFYVFY